MKRFHSSHRCLEDAGGADVFHIATARGGEEGFMLRDQQGRPALVLLKMGTREHMEKFRKGLLYMNTLDHFRRMEDDAARGDRYEGLTHIFQPKDVILKLDVPGYGKLTIQPTELAAPLTVAANAEACCNLLCLFSISAPVIGPLFPREHQWFGDSVVLVRNTQEFITRFTEAARSRGHGWRAKAVEYYDDASYTGKLDRFKKPLCFAHQREFRFAIDSPGTESLTLDIGDISDITSEIIPFEEANDALVFSEEDARAAGLHW